MAAKAGVQNGRWGIGVAVADYDNDGWPDLYVSNFRWNRLYHNNHNGTFSDVAVKAGVALGNWSTGATWGDCDGDGIVTTWIVISTSGCRRSTQSPSFSIGLLRFRLRLPLRCPCPNAPCPFGLVISGGAQQKSVCRKLHVARSRCGPACSIQVRRAFTASLYKAS